MKILFDARIHLNYYSGISRYIICLLEAYLQQFTQDDITVLLNPTIAPDNLIYQRLQKFSNVKFITIHTAHMGPKNYLVMGRIIRKLKPDVYHYPHLDAPIFTGDVPVVATVHDTNSSKNVKKYKDYFGLKSIYFKRSLQLTLKNADAVIFVSDSIKKEVTEKYRIKQDDNKFVRIYNGLESGFNKVDPETFNNFKNKFGLDHPYFLYVGQIREHKNVHRIVHAFELFHKKYPEYKLVLVGHNYLNKSFDSSSIIQIDKVSENDLKSLYANSQAFLFPTLFEGFGFPILEAYSFGKKVMTSNYGATKEIAGEYAYLVDPLSIEEIVAGMESLLNNDNRDEERVFHASQFSWIENALKLREVYLSVLKNKN